MQLAVCEDTLRISRTSLPQWVQSRALEGCEQVCRSGRDYWLYFDKLGFYYLLEICISAAITLVSFVLWIYWELNLAFYVIMVPEKRMRQCSLCYSLCLQLFRCDTVLECVFISAINVRSKYLVFLNTS